MSFRLPKLVVVLAALALGASACGSQGGSGGSSGGGGGGSTSSSSGGSSGQKQSQQPTPVAQIKNLSGVRTDVKLDPQFVKGLMMLKLTPGEIGSGTIKDGVAGFPITGGNVTYFKPGSTSPYVRGMIKHNGSGLSLDSGKTKVELTDFVINPANSKLYADVSANGKTAVKNAPIFFLNGSTLKPLKMKGNKAILQGTKVSLTQDAAQLLNKTFKTNALKKDFPVGTAKIILNTK